MVLQTQLINSIRAVTCPHVLVSSSAQKQQSNVFFCNGNSCFASSRRVWEPFRSNSEENPGNSQPRKATSEGEALPAEEEPAQVRLCPG